MKKTIIALFMIIGLNTLIAQTYSEPIYLILTSKTSGEEGIRRFVGKMDSLDNSPSISYYLTNRSRNVHLRFHHINMNPKKYKGNGTFRKNQMEKLNKPISFLETINPIDLDVLFPNFTRADYEAFVDSVYGKNIYIIDRSTIKNKTVELVQVECGHYKAPF